MNIESLFIVMNNGDVYNVNEFWSEFWAYVFNRNWQQIETTMAVAYYGQFLELGY